MRWPLWEFGGRLLPRLEAGLVGPPFVSSDSAGRVCVEKGRTEDDCSMLRAYHTDLYIRLHAKQCCVIR